MKYSYRNGHAERNTRIELRHPEFISGSVAILEVTPKEQSSKAYTDPEPSSG